MADNTPNLPPVGGGTPPAGVTPPTPPVPPAPAVGPKPGESGKIQPKKETVRINLPPKPTAAPTIKIPAPSAIHSAAPAAAAPAVSAAAPTAAAAPAQKGAAPASTATSAKAPPAPAPARAPVAPVYKTGGLDTVDKVLAIAAAVVAVLVLLRAVTL